MTYDIGDSIRLSATFTDMTGAAVDPSTVTLKLRPPGAAVVINAPVKDSTGNYHFDFVPGSDGDWFYRWEGSGAVAAVQEGFISVRASVCS